MNILITGGAGFIGSNLARQLVQREHNITIYDILSSQIHGNAEFDYKSISDNITFINRDIRDRQQLLTAMQHKDAIIHLAAETGTGQSMYEVEHYFDVNVRGTATLLDILTNESHSIRKVVVASSRAVYGEGKSLCLSCGEVYPEHRTMEHLQKGDFNVKCPMCDKSVTILKTDECSKKHPSSVYGLTKQYQEEMVLSICKNMNIPAIAFRYQNVYGPGQSLSNPYTGILSIFSTRIINNKEIEIYEDGQESRDFVYIDDVVNATILGLENTGVVSDVFNVGSGEAISVIEVAKKLRALFDSSIPIRVSGKFRIGDIRHNLADLTKVQKQLGFIPRVTFDTGINKFVKWVKIQPHPNDKYDKTVEELKKRGFYS